MNLSDGGRATTSSESTRPVMETDPKVRYATRHPSNAPEAASTRKPALSVDLGTTMSAMSPTGSLVSGLRREVCSRVCLGGPDTKEKHHCKVGRRRLGVMARGGESMVTSPSTDASKDTYLHPRFRARVLSRRAEVLCSVRAPFSSWRGTLAPSHWCCPRLRLAHTQALMPPAPSPQVSSRTHSMYLAGIGGWEGRGLRRGLREAGVGTNKWGVQRDDAVS